MSNKQKSKPLKEGSTKGNSKHNSGSIRKAPPPPPPKKEKKMSKDKEEVYLDLGEFLTCEMINGGLLLEDNVADTGIVYNSVEAKKLYEYLKEYYEQD